MDLLGHADLESLAESVTAGPQISLFIPTHRFGGGVQADRLCWKNLVSRVESMLAEDLRRPEVDALLAPARALQHDAMAWQYMSDGLAMFLRPGWHRTFRVPVPLPELATVGERLVIGPLLPMLSGDEHFLLLALNQREVRLFEGSRHKLDPVELTHMPRARESNSSHESRSNTMARPATTAGRGGPAVFYGHGAPDQHIKQDELQRFMRQVSTGLQDSLAGHSSPLVLVGLDRLVAGYREVNTYEHLIDEAVIHNSADVSAADLHALAWPPIEKLLDQQRADLLAVFRQLHGTGRVSSTVGTVRTAATEGRVQTLFLQDSPRSWGQVDGEAPTVIRLGADERYAVREQLDIAAVETLLNRGQIYANSQPLELDSDVAAIFRY